MQLDLSFDPGDSYIGVGDIIKQGGKNFKVTKVTKTAIAVSRHYWFDTAYEWLSKKFGGTNGTEVS